MIHNASITVSDSVIQDTIVVSIEVIPTINLNKEINNTTLQTTKYELGKISTIEQNTTAIIITEDNSSLKGMSINLSKEAVNSVENINDIQIQYIPQDVVSKKVPPHIIRLTDFFAIKQHIDGDIKIRLPLEHLPKGRQFDKARLYTYANTTAGYLYTSVITGKDVIIENNKPVLYITIPKMSGIFFIGIANSESALKKGKKKNSTSRALHTNIATIDADFMSDGTRLVEHIYNTSQKNYPTSLNIYSKTYKDIDINCYSLKDWEKWRQVNYPDLNISARDDFNEIWGGDDYSCYTSNSNNQDLIMSVSIYDYTSDILNNWGGLS